MDLNLLFDSIDEDIVESLNDVNSVGKSITINSYNVPDVEDFDIAIIGVTDVRGTKYKGDLEKAPFFIRSKLYDLKKGIGSYHIIDLGNLRKGINYEDTSARLSEVSHYLISKNILPLIIGGTHDLMLSQYQAYESFEKLISCLNVDAIINLNDSTVTALNERFLYDIFTKNPNYLFNYIHLADQGYLNDQNTLDTLDTLFFDHIRLGVVKDNLHEMEPFIREADMLSFDIGAIQKQYCPGNPISQVFGLSGEEACQLTWYSGLNAKMSSVGIYEYYPQYDDESFKTASVIATMLWYFIEGFYNRKNEKGFGSSDYLKYEISLDKEPQSIIFYKSKMTEKWWMEVPYPKEYHKFARNAIVPCNYSDYTAANKGEVPERWLEMQTKFG